MFAIFQKAHGLTFIGFCKTTKEAIPALFDKQLSANARKNLLDTWKDRNQAIEQWWKYARNIYVFVEAQKFGGED